MPDENENQNGEENGADDDAGDRGDEEQPQTVEELRAALEAEQRERAELHREAGRRRRHERELEQELEQLRAANLSENERAVEDARREGREAAEREASARIVRADVRAAAASRLRDPDDALAHLDVDELAGLDDDARGAAIASALDELIERKPYLAAAGGGDEDGERTGVLSQGSRTRRARGDEAGGSDSSAWLRKAARRSRG
jgi:hypothetical protein